MEKVPGWLDFVKVLPKKEKTLLTLTLRAANDLFGEDIDINHLKALDWDELQSYEHKTVKLLRVVFKQD